MASNYNDPEIGSMFESLASLFAPPRSEDAVNYMKARGIRDQNERMGALWGMAQDPQVNRSAFDLSNIAAGNYAPTQSMYKVDRDYDANMLNNQQSFLSNMFKPLDQGQVRPAVSEAFTTLMNLPAVPEVRGAPKPLTGTELTAQIVSRLSPEIQKLWVGNMGSKPTNGMAQLPDGRSVNAVQNMDGTWRNAQTREMLPDDARVFHMPQIQGGMGDVGLSKSTTSELEKEILYDTELLANLDSYEEALRKTPGTQGLVGDAFRLIRNAPEAMSELKQMLSPHLAEMVSALDAGVLTREVVNIPDLSALNAADASRVALTFMLAKNLGGGRLSDKDYRNAELLLGGRGLTANTKASIARVQQQRERVDRGLKLKKEMLSGYRGFADIGRSPEGAQTSSGQSFAPTPPMQPQTLPYQNQTGPQMLPQEAQGGERIYTPKTRDELLALPDGALIRNARGLLGVKNGGHVFPLEGGVR